MGKNGLRKSSQLQRALLIVLLLVSTVSAYDLTRLENTSGDTISNRYWPVSIIKHHTLTLDPFKKDLEGVDYAAIYFSDGHWYPRSFWGIAIFTVPFYAIMDWLDLGGVEWSHDRINHVSRWNAIFCASLSNILLFLLLCQIVPDLPALAATLVFALGSWQWSLGAQGLSNQTISVLLVIVGMWLSWLRPRRFPQLLGLMAALVWSVRPQDIFLLIPMGLLLQSARERISCLATLALLVAPLIWAYEKIYLGPLGWSSALLSSSGDFPIYRANPLPIVAGLLYSPNRGAAVFFPLLLLVPRIWSELLPSLPIRSILAPLKKMRFPSLKLNSGHGISQVAAFQVWGLGALLYFISLSFLDFWHGTWSYGARYLYDLEPLVWPVIALAFGQLFIALNGQTARLPKWLLAMLVFCSIQGAAVHGLGHRNFDIYIWNFKADVTDRRAWDFSDLMLQNVWRAGSNRNRWGGALERLKQFGF